MNYQEAIEYVYNLKRFGSKLGLKIISHLLELMENPHENFNSILIGGTNGKGSTVAMIASILQEAGFKVGMFTSPHLSSYTERIIVNKERIKEDEIIRILSYIKPLMEKMSEDPNLRHPTFFEATTALAFEYFREKKTDFAVLEVGLGGRLDATNVVNSLVSVITNVSLEHTKILGNTIFEIAREKAGIIKKNGTLVTSTQDDRVYSLFKKICEEKNSRIFRVGENIGAKQLSFGLNGQEVEFYGLKNNYKVKLPLLGDHQILNACCAIAAVESLEERAKKKAIIKGLEKVRWPGRLEVMQENPLVVLDCAKDILAMKKLKEAVLKFFDYDRLILVTSISSDKKIEGMMNEILPITDFVIITKHKVMNRAADPKLIGKEVKKHLKKFLIIENVKDAVRKALSLSDKKDLILVTGSVFTVGEARELWKKDVDVRWGRELNEGWMKKK